MILAGSFGDGFQTVWHYGGYIAGGALAAAIVLVVVIWILSIFFDG